MIESNNDRVSLVLFGMEGQRYALRLEAVERVIRAVAVTPVPETPPFLLGLVNLAGQLLSVVSLRACLGLPDRAIRTTDQFVIARTSRLALALIVDDVRGLIAVEIAQIVAVEDALPRGEYRVHGLVKIEGDIILIYDLDKLISPENQERILQAQTPAEM